MAKIEGERGRGEDRNLISPADTTSCRTSNLGGTSSHVSREGREERVRLSFPSLFFVVVTLPSDDNNPSVLEGGRLHPWEGGLLAVQTTLAAASHLPQRVLGPRQFPSSAQAPNSKHCHFPAEDLFCCLSGWFISFLG